MTQWQAELYEKFNLNVPIYDGQRLLWRRTHGWDGPIERRINREEWHREPFVLCSSHLMRRADRTAEMLRAEDWDLIVLDEAHHARRKSPGSPQEGGPNRLLRLMQGLKDRARSLVLLTATPMQVHPVEVWDLLNLLGLPPRWAANSDDFARYFRLAAGNPGGVDLDFLAEMFRAVEDYYGPVGDAELAPLASEASPLTPQKALNALRHTSTIPLKRLDPASRKVALEALRRFSPIHHRMSRHTRALLRHYHKHGLIDAPIAERAVRDVPVDLTAPERELYEAVEDYISTTYNNASPRERSSVGFIMTIYRRRLASSFHALYRTLVKRLSGEGLAVDEEDISQDELREDVMDADDADEIARRALVAEERESINGLLKRIAMLGTDSKLAYLKVEVENAFEAGYSSAILFTQYADTMDRVREFLAEELPGVPIATYSGRGGEARDLGGSWVACTKDRIKQKLKDGSVRLLVCTDAAAEGLNLQTCGALINIDLPWNPMKVEQRIGRIDRIGQRHPTIRVVNLAYRDTVEADVYFALRNRINLFQGIVGKLQPILSRLPHEFERVALERPEHRGATRDRLLSDVERLADGADEAGFDIDEVGGDSLRMPELPPAALTLDDLDRVLNRLECLPPGSEWSPLDLGSYAFRMPGMPDKVRVTTRADVFEDHFESHEFLSPAGDLFERLAVGPTPAPSADGEADGNCWLVERGEDGAPRELVVSTRQGSRRVSSIPELIDALEDLAAPAAFGLADSSIASVRRLV